MDAVERNCARETGVALDTFKNLPAIREKRRRVEELLLAFVVDEAAVKEHAQLRDPEIKAHWGATHASPMEGADALIPSWVEELRVKNFRVKCEKASVGEEQLYGKLVSAAKERELEACKKFKVLKPVTVGAPAESLLSRTRAGRPLRRWLG